MQRIRSSGIRTAMTGLGVVLIGAVLAVPITVAAEDTQVEEVEIREYRRERLGSIDDFRGNSIKDAQYVDEATYTLLLDGLVDQPVSWGYAELCEMDHLAKLVTIDCVEGWSVKALWEGTPLAQLFEQVQPREEADTVSFDTADGYTTSLPLGFILVRNVIIADRINGIVLPPENGFPLELVAVDKWGHKWIKWIVRVELSDDPSYRGFREPRRHDNESNVDGPTLGDWTNQVLVGQDSGIRRV